MKYKRQDKAKSSEEPPIQKQYGHYNQVNTSVDPGWIESFLQELHEDSLFGLSQLQSSIDYVKSLELKEYKPEVQKQKKEAPLIKAKESLLNFLKKHLETAESNVNRAYNEILRESEPKHESDPTRALLRELRNQEIRQLIRKTDPKLRHDLIASNLDYIQAAADSPDKLLSDEHLIKIRRDYAFQIDPSLIQYEADQKRIYEAVRRRAGEVSATANLMTMDQTKLDADINPELFFSIFRPSTDHEKTLADKVILNYQRKQAEVERKQQFEESNQGINLEPSMRRARK